MKNQKLTYWVITVALAGFLFGFDTIVISGADQPIQQLWGSDYPCVAWLEVIIPVGDCADRFHGFFIMSMALWGTVLGSLFGGIPCDKLGRKTTLFWIGILYLVSALGSGLSTDPYLFSFFRFIGGIGVGASSVAAPIYISEIAPDKQRGRLGATYQFNIVFGIFVAFFSNYLLGLYLGENAWRWMLGIEALPAAIYTLMVLGVPKSPRWLVLKKNDIPTASVILAQINPQSNIEDKIAEIKNSIAQTTTKARLFSKKYQRPLMLAFLLAFFNQMSGINFVLYYAPRIFESAGIDQSNTLMASIPIGAVNLAFTLLGMYLIDRMGRRQLVLIGSVGYISMLLGVAWSFYTGAEGIIVVFFVSAFVGAHAIGQGAVIWVFISEIFATQVRSSGMSFGAGTLWIMAALITMVTPAVLSSFSTVSIFLFFAGMMVLQLFWALLFMLETKGVSLEDLQKKLAE
ncbi:MAG: sugar porter family MFS transporter [Bacteroidota bacterium]